MLFTNYCFSYYRGAMNDVESIEPENIHDIEIVEIVEIEDAPSSPQKSGLMKMLENPKE